MELRNVLQWLSISAGLDLNVYVFCFFIRHQNYNPNSCWNVKASGMFICGFVVFTDGNFYIFISVLQLLMSSLKQLDLLSLLYEHSLNFFIGILLKAGKNPHLLVNLIVNEKHLQ